MPDTRHGRPLAAERPTAPFAVLPLAVLAAATLATTLVAAWLFMVSLTVLPVRDPGHVTTWILVACGCLGYALLSGAFVLRGRRVRWLAPVTGAASLAALLFGGFAITSSLQAGHFEGYLLLIGVIVGGHGLCALGATPMVALGGGRAPRT
jgi:hypothetical protein